MAISQMTREFSCPVQQVWNVVTNLEDTSWRSDLARVEVLSETTFVEYTKSGFATTFTVTACEKPTFWAFRMENENMSGHWEGRFASTKAGTQVTFVESVTAKRWWMRPLVPGYLKRQQKAYLADLAKKLDGK